MTAKAPVVAMTSQDQEATSLDFWAGEYMHRKVRSVGDAKTTNKRRACRSRPYHLGFLFFRIALNLEFNLCHCHKEVVLEIFPNKLI